MPLITCGDCGKEISTRAKACPHCGAPCQEEEAPKVQKVVAVDPAHEAGKELGAGCMGLALAAPAAYLAFVVTWIFGGVYLASRAGHIVEGEDPDLWVGFVVLVLPFLLVYPLRKPIRIVGAVVLGSGMALILLAPALLLTLWIVGEVLQLIF